MHVRRDTPWRETGCVRVEATGVQSQVGDWDGKEVLAAGTILPFDRGWKCGIYGT